MPTQTIWVHPQRFLEHQGVKVFHTYKDDDLAQGPNRFWFTLHPECSVETFRCGQAPCPHVFDVRALSTWQPPVRPPCCTGEDDTAENQAACYWQQEKQAMAEAVKDAIEQGELGRLNAAQAKR